MTTDTPETALQSTMLTRVAIGISIAVHMAAVALSLGYAGAGLFDSPSDEAVPVSLVTQDDVAAQTPEPAPSPVAQKPEPDFSKLDLRPAATESQPQQQQPPSQAQPEQPKSRPAKTAAQQKQQQAVAQPAPPPQAAQPAYTPPQPDISTKYQVDLGLKALAPLADAPGGGKTDFDDAAMKRADIDTSSIATFRAQLKQCGVLPAQIGPEDKVVIVLRATFTRDAKLAAPPTLIEASASAKGPALMQAAIQALQDCQPYTTLPADKYAEWRVLDLRFTPQDFKRG